MSFPVGCIVLFVIENVNISLRRGLCKFIGISRWYFLAFLISEYRHWLLDSPLEVLEFFGVSPMGTMVPCLKENTCVVLYMSSFKL